MSTQATLEQEEELKQFLKVARPDWSLPRRNGHCDVVRACAKLKAIGVTDVHDLISRVARNTINDDLSEAQKPRFSRETLHSIRKEGAFYQSLTHLSEPSYRQIGLFAPVPQLLSGTNLRTKALKATGSNSGVLHPVTGRTSHPGGHRLLSAGSRRSDGTLRPSTVDGTGTSCAVSSIGSLDTSRSRPPTIALSIPYSSRGDVSEDGGFSDIEVLPRLRHARPKPPSRDISHMLWKRDQSKSTSSLTSLRMNENVLPPATAPGGSRGDAKLNADLQPNAAPERQTLMMTADSLRGSMTQSMPRLVSGGEQSLPGVGRAEPPAAAWSIAFSNQPSDDDDDIKRQVEKWTTAGVTMSSGPLLPGWSSCKTSDSMAQHGEAMLREQEDLHHKKKLFQQMALEGTESPMRRHVTGQIQSRLKEEKMHDAQASMEVDQTCVSIRKNIDAMSKARKSLSLLRNQVQKNIEPDGAAERMKGLSLDFFGNSKKKVAQEAHDPASVRETDVEAESPAPSRVVSKRQSTQRRSTIRSDNPSRVSDNKRQSVAPRQSVDKKRQSVARG